VQQFGENWTSGKLYETHSDVNGLKVKASAKEDEYRLAAYVYPAIGKIPIADVTESDIERVMREAEKRARKSTGARSARARGSSFTSACADCSTWRSGRAGSALTRRFRST
jgi:hypothetical protein